MKPLVLPDPDPKFNFSSSNEGVNLFILSRNPLKAAEFNCDAHVRKIIVESAQLLASSYTLKELRKAPNNKFNQTRSTRSHPHHPITKWVNEDLANWEWTLRHALWLCREYRIRSFRQHFTERFIKWCVKNYPSYYDDQEGGYQPTDFVGAFGKSSAIKAEIVHNPDMDIVEAYRKYYLLDKTSMLCWTNVSAPAFMKGNVSKFMGSNQWRHKECHEQFYWWWYINNPKYYELATLQTDSGPHASTKPEPFILPNFSQLKNE